MRRGVIHIVLCVETEGHFAGYQIPAVGQFETVLDNIYSGNISAAASINNTINTSCTIEYYRKAVNAIYLGTWGQGIKEFSSSDSAFLLTVANGDPIEWGDAVYSAQVMVDFYPTAPSPFREIESENEDVIQESYAVYPNPNDGNMTVEYSIEDDAELQITGITGKLMCCYNLSAKEMKTEISCNSLANGVYLCKVVYNDK